MQLFISNPLPYLRGLAFVYFSNGPPTANESLTLAWPDLDDLRGWESCQALRPNPFANDEVPARPQAR
jgi:hypothetical protein